MNDVSQILEWVMIVILVILFCGAPLVMFFKKSEEQRIEALREWLKYAVTYAEKALGSGTGQLKLREVYNMALSQFPWLPKLISFEMFSDYVDEALIWMRAQLEKNAQIKGFVEKKDD